MFCSNCGKPVAPGDKFCLHCGAAVAEKPLPQETSLQNQAPPQQQPVAQVPPPHHPAPPAGKFGKRRGKIIAAVAAAVAICIAAAVWLWGRDAKELSYWPKEPPAGDAGTTWAFDMGDMGEGETIVSVSPSGKYILAVERLELDLTKRFASGVANEFGRQVRYVALYTKQEDAYVQTGRIDIAPEENLALNDTLAACQEDGIAWNGNETQVLITVGTSAKSYMLQMHSDIYLLDFSGQTFENLTGRDDMPSEHRIFLPQWADDENIRYIRYNVDGDWRVGLMGMNVKTGEQEHLADLSDEGRAVFIADYQIYGDAVYYSRDNTDLDRSGFFSAKLDGGISQPACLLGIGELRESLHPYIKYFSSVEISQDGRWACLTASDMRMAMRDIPLTDHPELPQTDPGSAVSIVQGQKWVPCHNVFLFDLESGELAEPFAAKELCPDVVIATAATFAPDGKSLLCAVFGDGGPWSIGSFSKTALYQINLAEESFDTVRICGTEVETVPDKITWLGDHTVLLRFSGGLPPLNPVDIVKPAAFESFG